MKTNLDAKDAALYQARLTDWGAIDGPRVGDFVEMLDGTLRRFTHDWGESIQTTVGDRHPCAGDQSFYWGGDYMSFSGSLDPAIPKLSLELTEQKRDGWAWFFHHDEMRAHNGVSVAVPCRVYREVAANV